MAHMVIDLLSCTTKSVTMACARQRPENTAGAKALPGKGKNVICQNALHQAEQ